MSRFRLSLGPHTAQTAGIYSGNPPPGTFRMGVNMSGPESGNNYPTFDMLAHYAAHGITYIRQPVGWNTMQPVLGGSIPSGTGSEYAKLSGLLAIAAMLGITVLVDVHANGRYDGNGGSNTYIVGGPNVSTTQFADFSGKLAAKLVADPNYAAVHGYDIMNEWHDMDTAYADFAGPPSTPASRAVIGAAVQGAITQIRNAGFAKPIYVELDHYTGAWDWVTNNAALFLSFIDPLNLLVASVHCYLDNDSSGTNFAWIAETQKPGAAPPGLACNLNIGPQRMSAVTAWAAQNGVKLHLGECGWGFDNAGWNSAGDAMLAFCQRNNIEATYWSSGNNFTAGVAGYGYNPDPYNANTGARDYTAAGTPSHQSAILQKYAGAPTTYVFSLPVDSNLRPVRYAAVGQASAPFKILFGGLIASPITITPNDSGAGGTFTPASIVLTAGQHINDSLSFTYTPATSAQFTINVTNNGGLTNPPSLTFSSILDPFVQSGLTVDPINVIWPKRIYSTYMGKAATLAKTSALTSADNGATFPASIPTQDISFLANGTMDTATLDTWSGGAATSVVRFYDQGLAGQNIGPIITGGQTGVDQYNRPVGDNKAGPASSVDNYQNGTYMGITPSLDCPAFVENAYNGLPALRFNASRMDAPSVINGLSGFTLLFAANPNSVADAAFIFDWIISDSFQICDTGGNWLISSETSQGVPINIVAGSMHVYALRFDGANKLRDVFVDGAKLSPSMATSQTVLRNEVSPGTGNTDAIPTVRLGYFPYYPSGKSKFDLAGFITIPAALTDAQIGVFMTRMTADLGVVQIGAPGAMTLNGTIGTTDIPVKIASAPANATTISWQRSPAGAGSWTAAGSTTVSAGASALQFDFTGLGSNTSYDLRAIGVNGSYQGGASQLLGQRTQASTPGTGRTVQYIGMSYSHYENVPGEDDTANAGLVPQMTYAQSVGMNLIRIPFHWPWIQGTLGGPLGGSNVIMFGVTSDQYLANLKAAVAAAKAKGHTVILDMHDYAGYGSAGNIGSGGSASQAQFAQVWGLIASVTDWKNDASVWFELMNEPNSNIGDVFWLQCQNAAIAAIRQAGASNKIVVTGPGSSPFAFYDIPGGPSAFVDSANNFIVTVHGYFDYPNYQGFQTQVGNSGVGIEGSGDGNAGESGILKATLWGRANGVKMFYGEFGTGRDAAGAAVLSSLFEYMQANGDVWQAAAIFYGGGGYGTTGLSIAPTDGTGAENWGAPTTDSPQIAAMKPYMLGGSRRGQTPQPVVIPQQNASNGASWTFGAGLFPNEAGSVSGSGTIIYSNASSVADSLGAGGVTLVASVKISAPGTANNLIGKPACYFMSVNASGHLGATYGDQYTNPGTIVVLQSTSAAGIVADNQPHHIELSVGPAGGFLFVDGVIVAQSATTLAQAGIGSSQGQYYGGLLTVDPTVKFANHGLFASQRHTAAFTPSATPLTGTEDNLVGFWPLAMDGSCYL